MTAIPLPGRSQPKWFAGSMPVARFGLIVNLSIPLLLLIYDANRHALGVNAVNFAIHTTGIIAVICLLLSLCVTPLRNVTGFTWLVQFRRSLGVWAFYYAVAHLAIYFWWDRQGSASSTVFEITHRFYLGIGFNSLALMVPLWATSFNRAIRAMGAKWWKRLHRLAYLAAAFACYHFYLQTKADKRLPDVAIGVLAFLLLWRVAASIVRKWRTPAKGQSTATAGKAGIWAGQLKVVDMFRETDSVRTFRFAAPGGGPIPFAFKAGQFLNLTVEIDRKKVHRSYTIASPPTRTGYVELTIKREENGQVSKYLHDMLMTGHSVAVSAPAGRFTFDPGDDLTREPGVVLIAGGVGITPVMSILRELTDLNWPGQIDLVFSVQSAGAVIFADELRSLGSRHPNLHVHVTITRDAPADWQGSRGRVSAALLKDLVPPIATRRAFVCGPDAMAHQVREQLVVAGVPADRITLESFTPAAVAAKVLPANGVAVSVTFTTSAKTAPMTADQTVLEAAESVGVEIDNQCRAGICGTCRCRLISGAVTMDNRDALSDADEAAGYILACQAHAAADISVEA